MSLSFDFFISEEVVWSCNKRGSTYPHYYINVIISEEEFMMNYQTLQLQVAEY